MAKNPFPSITVVIVNYNAGTHLALAVTSALVCQHVKHVIVSDNKSTDSSLQTLTKSDKLTLIRNSKNLGFAAGNNVALPTINTEFILFLNPDGHINEAALSQLLEHMQIQPTSGMSGPLILNEDGTEQRGCRRDEPTPWAALKTLLGKRAQGINHVGTPLPNKPVEVDAISGACMFVRKEALDDVGPMDEGYFLHCEDLDWCKRFREKGWGITFVPQATVTHFKGGSSRKRPIRVEWHKHAGMVRYYAKFYRDTYPKPLMWVVYTMVWFRFFLMMPIWWVKGLLA